MNMLTIIVSATLTLGSLALGTPPEDDLLAGPSMQQEEITEDDMRSRKLQETGKKNKLNSRKQHSLWMSALESIELTSEQKVETIALLSDLREKQQAFHKTYGKEVAEIQKQHRVAKKNDKVLSDESRKRSMELMELAPDVKVYQEKAWVLLTQDQQKTFQTNYQSLLDEDEKLRKENKGKDRPRRKEDKPRGFGPEDSMVDNRDTLGGKSNRQVDSVDRRKDSVNDRSLRRIKFLRRLQQLENDK